MPAFAGECQEIFMDAIFAFHPGKAVVQVAAIKITVNDLLKIGTEESVGPREKKIHRKWPVIFASIFTSLPQLRRSRRASP